MPDKMQKLWDKLLDLLYPPRCPFCRSLLKDSEKTLCSACMRTLPWTKGEAQVRHFAHVKRCVSPLYYEGSVRSSLLRYKFRGYSGYAKNYSQILAKCIDENGVSCDIITWAPIGKKRLRSRGYDQSRLLAEQIAAIRGLRCEQLLIKVADNPPQSSIRSAEKRRANVSGIYAAVDPDMLRGKEILLIDDIVTSGATLSECARTLKAAGAASVCAAAVAGSKR